MLHSVPILKNLLIRAFVFFSYTSVDYESTGSRKIFKGMLMIVTFDQIVKTGKALQPVFISATGISMDECTDSSGYRGSLVSVFISLPKYFDRRSFNINYVMYLIVNPFFFISVWCSPLHFAVHFSLNEGEFCRDATREYFVAANFSVACFEYFDAGRLTVVWFWFQADAHWNAGLAKVCLEVLGRRRLRVRFQ